MNTDGFIIEILINIYIYIYMGLYIYIYFLALSAKRVEKSNAMPVTMRISSTRS